VLKVLHGPRFADQPPAEVYAQLLEGKIMYRILAANPQVRDRRIQLRHPELPCATARGNWPTSAVVVGHQHNCSPFKSTWYHPYVLLDVYSRFVVGVDGRHREHARPSNDTGVQRRPRDRAERGSWSFDCNALVGRRPFAG
jgi:putative transposase